MVTVTGAVTCQAPSDARGNQHANLARLQVKVNATLFRGRSPLLAFEPGLSLAGTLPRRQRQPAYSCNQYRDLSRVYDRIGLVVASQTNAV
jgi:hypothetical protein